ncbi:MAG TPA: hypothetical protein VF824_01530 [Thermoanaerobaculia bacterium]|jgi:hypothetical protein
MKRTLSVIALFAVVLSLAACGASTMSSASTPSMTGVITSISGNAITVTPNGGGAATTINRTWGTRVFWQSGLEASGSSVLSVGQPVQVWLDNGTQNAARIVIAQ